MTRSDEKENPLYNDAMRLRQQGELQRALELFAVAGRQSELWATAAHTARSEIFQAMGLLDEAEVELRRGLELRPFAKLTSYMLFTLLVRQGKLEEAIFHSRAFLSRAAPTKVDPLIMDWRAQLEDFEAHLESGQIESLRRKALRADWNAPPVRVFSSISAIREIFLSPTMMLKRLSSAFSEEPILEIEKLAHYYNWFKKGVSVLVQRETVVSVLLYGERRNGFIPFYGLLPYGVRLVDNYSSVIEKFGDPSRKGQCRARDWLAYDFSDLTFHLEFFEGGRDVALVTIENQQN